jgi:protein-S-isoprenylcysteine O-methyltransferase Ste14
MTEWIEAASVVAVSFAAFGRCLGIFGAKFRQLAYRRRAAAYPTSWRDRCTQPEPFLLFALTLFLVASREAPVEPPAVLALLSALGAASATAGISLMLWAVVSFPTVSTGHYVLPEQRVVTRGPYGWVRHPLYLAAFLIWLGVAATFRSPAALLALVLYVVPGYVVYIRSEERMMEGHFGEAYRAYARRVGMLVPRRPSNAS